MDASIRLPDGTWHREVAQQCWTRTDPGPVRVFTTQQEAETFASGLRPTVLQGCGQTATQPVSLPTGVYVASFTHNGARNFIVKSFQGSNEDLLINKIGAYQGARPLGGGTPITFDIQADGAWTIRIEPIGQAAAPAFSGMGDAVSGLFNPPPSEAWEITHSGQRNFIVYLQCAGGRTLVQNQIGPVNGSPVVQLGRGPCFWEVQADGNWSLNPR